MDFHPSKQRSVNQHAAQSAAVSKIQSTVEPDIPDQPDASNTSLFCSSLLSPLALTFIHKEEIISLAAGRLVPPSGCFTALLIGCVASSGVGVWLLHQLQSLVHAGCRQLPVDVPVAAAQQVAVGGPQVAVEEGVDEGVDE